MRTNFFSHKLFGHPNESGTSRQISRDIPGSSLPNPRKTNFRGGQELFDHHPFACETLTPPGGLWTQNLIFVLFFLALKRMGVRNPQFLKRGVEYPGNFRGFGMWLWMPSKFGNKFGEPLGGSQAPSFWKVPGRTFPGVPSTSAEVPRDFPGSSVTVELNSNAEFPQKFARLPWKFPGLPQRSAPFSGKRLNSQASLSLPMWDLGLPEMKAEVVALTHDHFEYGTPSPDSRKLSRTSCTKLRGGQTCNN